MVQKLQKSLEGDITTLPESQRGAEYYHLLMIFAVCNIIAKVQFLIFIFAVLLPNICNV